MSSSVKNLLIGALMLGAIALFVGFVLFLRPSVGDEKQTLYVRFSNINKINVGTRVLFAGKPVGEVSAITTIRDARETQPTDEIGQVYFYQLTLKIDSNVRVYTTDTIELQTSGLLGEKSVAIIPRAPPAGTTPQQVTDKSPFYADSIDPIENTFHQIGILSDKIGSTVDLLHNWFKENSPEITKLITHIDSVADEASKIVASINQEQIIAKFGQGLTLIDTSLTQMQQGKVFENLSQTMKNVKTISEDIASGKGTLGKLITSDDFYLRFNAILSKADTTMNDINHYGILFNLNKKWQRERLRQISALNALDTPQGFRSYFEGEVDQINTAMARLSMLIEKAKSTPQEEHLLDTPAFRKDFAELLREIEEMSLNLKLYNQQLMETP